MLEMSKTLDHPLLQKIFVDWFSSPVILDDFTDHQKRRYWRASLSKSDPELSELMKKNKLRNTSVRNPMQMIGFIDQFVDKEDLEDIKKFALNELDWISENWESSTTNEKLDKIKQYDGFMKYALSKILTYSESRIIRFTNFSKLLEIHT